MPHQNASACEIKDLRAVLASSGRTRLLRLSTDEFVLVFLSSQRPIVRCLARRRALAREPVGLVLINDDERRAAPESFRARLDDLRMEIVYLKVKSKEASRGGR